MSPLRQRMIEDMTLAGLSPTTQAIYIKAVRGLPAHYHRSPDKLSEEEVRSYLLGMRERGAALGSSQQGALACAHQARGIDETLRQTRGERRTRRRTSERAHCGHHILGTGPRDGSRIRRRTSSRRRSRGRTAGTALVGLGAVGSEERLEPSSAGQGQQARPDPNSTGTHWLGRGRELRAGSIAFLPAPQALGFLHVVAIGRRATMMHPVNT